MPAAPLKAKAEAVISEAEQKMWRWPAGVSVRFYKWTWQSGRGEYLDGKYPVGNFGVKTAVDEFVQELGIREIFVTCEPHLWKSWYFQKRT